MTQVNIKFTQNFLKDRSLVKKIVTIANIPRGSVVLEVGPGKGIITSALASAVESDGKVVAVELDTKLASALTEKFIERPQVEIISANILDFPLSKFKSNYSIFSNLPFAITSDLLDHLLDPAVAPSQAHLILQRESIIGINKIGMETETFKSLLLKPFYEVQLEHAFSKFDFAPKPSVETALFSFQRREHDLIEEAAYALYKDFLAFVAKDRVGEGNWRRLFKKKALQNMLRDNGLVGGRGLKSQSVESLVAVFKQHVMPNEVAKKMVAGSLQTLRDEQVRLKKANLCGRHHQSNSRRRKR